MSRWLADGECCTAAYLMVSSAAPDQATFRLPSVSFDLLAFS